MTETRDDRAPDYRSAGGWVVIVGLLLVVAYPFSIGPMYWLCDQGYVAGDNPFWMAFYRPLTLCMEHSDWFYESMMAYIGWWIS